jgi:hypothetical protein
MTTNEDAGLLTDAYERPLFTAAFESRHEFDVFPGDLRSGFFNEFVAGWYAALRSDRGAVLAPSKVQVEAVRATLPQPVIDALRFYAHGHHYNIDDDHQQFDTVSGEPQNWLFSERDDDCTMIEDGSIAKAVLLGGLLGFEEPTEPLEGEVFVVAASGGEKV